MPPTPTETFDDEGDTPAQPPSALKTEKEARLERGTGLLKKGQFEEAAKAFEEAIAADATDARAHNRLSLALKKQGEAALELDAAAASGHFEAARKACDEAIRLDPARFAHRADKFEALRARAEAHRTRGSALYAKRKLVAGWYPGVVQARHQRKDGTFTLAIQLDDGDVEPSVPPENARPIDALPAPAGAGLVVGAKVRARCDGAEEELRRAVALDAQGVEAHRWLGLALRAKGLRAKKALADLPDEARGDAEQAADRALDEAKAAFEAAIGLDAGSRSFFKYALKPSAPACAAAHNDLGLLLHATGDAAGAEKAVAEAVRLAPDSEKYRRHLASLLNGARAEEEMHEAVRIRSNDKTAKHVQTDHLAHWLRGELKFKSNNGFVNADLPMTIPVNVFQFR